MYIIQTKHNVDGNKRPSNVGSAGLATKLAIQGADDRLKSTLEEFMCFNNGPATTPKRQQIEVFHNRRVDSSGPAHSSLI